ncbi:gluconate kinase, SKI family [Pseudarthrobacter phenanthrenivorans Sphe3]|uniref:Gluconokinase n=1 Tax=Pseudarthrobacter phenanthrenivorans (strain DSM 18606 / JCM 16027 / LMG 23796 / Sphe3) TaxID=930171 RepID=F0MB03_PSEPM|nr:gluconokinase [Pseudarthrobacter phenanthrenivorans]ADX72879.1 gluconate kinase, SKI family [Pseudarthrobacter phenanthrenivorans Sphe3]
MSQLPALVVMGVSGCGKSTVGSLLGERLGVPFFDGDDFHPPANKAKMAAGIPLNDDDRAPWLTEIGMALVSPAGEAGSSVIACSALKRSYRDLLRSFAPDTVFIHLTGDAATISDRLSSREHEYMPGSLLASQLATLEPLEPDEPHIAMDIREDPESLVNRLVRHLVDLPSKVRIS